MFCVIFSCTLLFALVASGAAWHSAWAQLQLPELPKASGTSCFECDTAPGWLQEARSCLQLKLLVLCLSLLRAEAVDEGPDVNLCCKLFSELQTAAAGVSCVRARSRYRTTTQQKHDRDRVPWVRKRTTNRKNEEGRKGNPIALCIAKLGSAPM